MICPPSRPLLATGRASISRDTAATAVPRRLAVDLRQTDPPAAHHRGTLPASRYDKTSTSFEATVTIAALP